MKPKSREVMRIEYLLRDIMIQTVVTVISSVILYAIFQIYPYLTEIVYDPLVEIFPKVPPLLLAIVILTIVVGLIYRLVRSVRFHRYVESTYHHVLDFLKLWDEFHQTFYRIARFDGKEEEFSKALGSLNKILPTLQYRYPKIYSMIRKISRYDYIDPALGIKIRNFDPITDLIMKSPITGMKWFNRDLIVNDFENSWQPGRTSLVTTLGFLDNYRKSISHMIFQKLHLLPITKEE